MARAPRNGPGARKANDAGQPQPATAAGKRRMDTSVSRQPRHVCSDSADPFERLQYRKLHILPGDGPKRAVNHEGARHGVAISNTW